MTALRMGSTVLLALLVCGFAPTPRPKTNKAPDLGELAGAWRAVRYEQNGRDLLGQRSLFMRLAKDQLTFHVDGFEEQQDSTYQVTVNLRTNPAAMYWRRGAGKTVSYAGIYALKGRTLSIAFTEARLDVAEHGRPTSLAALRPRDYLLVFERIATGQGEATKD